MDKLSFEVICEIASHLDVISIKQLENAIGASIPNYIFADKYKEIFRKSINEIETIRYSINTMESMRNYGNKSSKYSIIAIRHSGEIRTALRTEQYTNDICKFSIMSSCNYIYEQCYKYDKSVTRDIIVGVFVCKTDPNHKVFSIC